MLIKTLLDYPNVILKTANENFPHHLTSYAYDLTRKFTSFYSNVQVNNEDNNIKKLSRLYLVSQFIHVVTDTFRVL